MKITRKHTRATAITLLLQSSCAVASMPCGVAIMRRSCRGMARENSRHCLVRLLPKIAQPVFRNSKIEQDVKILRMATLGQYETHGCKETLQHLDKHSSGSAANAKAMHPWRPKVAGVRPLIENRSRRCTNPTKRGRLLHNVFMLTRTLQPNHFRFATACDV